MCLILVILRDTLSSHHERSRDTLVAPLPSSNKAVVFLIRPVKVPILESSEFRKILGHILGVPNMFIYFRQMSISRHLGFMRQHLLHHVAQISTFSGKCCDMSRHCTSPQSAKSSSASARLRELKNQAPFSGILVSRLPSTRNKAFRYVFFKI